MSEASGNGRNAGRLVVPIAATFALAAGAVGIVLWANSQVSSLVNLIAESNKQNATRFEASDKERQAQFSEVHDEITGLKYQVQRVEEKVGAGYVTHGELQATFDLLFAANPSMTKIPIK